jgi:hypothetical protein
MKSIGFVLMAVLLTGCFVTVPRSWSTEKSAFPAFPVAESSSPGLVASRQAIMNFTFADVYSSAEKALSFAQINVTEANETLGAIYGTRSALVKGMTRKYYYFLQVKEEGPEKCTVYVYSKQQQSARYIKWLPSVVLPSVGLAAFAFGLMGTEYLGSTLGAALVYPVILVPVTWYMNRTAMKNAELKWSDDDDEYLDRIMSFMRTDLLQK